MSGDDHVEAEATWAVYQQMIAAYRNLDRAAGRVAMKGLIDSLRTKTPAVVAYFDWPGISNGSTKAINGRLEHLRGPRWGLDLDREEPGKSTSSASSNTMGTLIDNYTNFNAHR